MKYTIQSEDFSARFIVCDTEGLARYSVKNEMDSIMRKLTIFDLADDAVCTVEKKFFTLRPTYEIYNKHHQLVLNVRKKFNLIRPQFTISSTTDEYKFRTTGDHFGSKFSITEKNYQDTIAKITRKCGYTLDICDDKHDPLALVALVMIVHLCCHSPKDE